eukprot:TRINITY_DN17018_c0_g1_i1.p1 TRINITY_DN17018_c0_g1~~TRINITY_DN17018_c0_g1_i1.p1  ORF type:complete len:416 (+),score=113.30 TRINITY_DN17018_c0_g1_i1:80-1327(+)
MKTIAIFLLGLIMIAGVYADSEAAASEMDETPEVILFDDQTDNESDEEIEDSDDASDNDVFEVAPEHFWRNWVKDEDEDQAGSFPTLRKGMRNSACKALQYLLRNKGYLRISSCTTYYGSMTAAAVSAFQRANGISADGVAGASTITKLVAATAKSSIQSDVNRAIQTLLGVTDDGWFGNGTLRALTAATGATTVGLTQWQQLFTKAAGGSTSSPSTPSTPSTPSVTPSGGDCTSASDCKRLEPLWRNPGGLTYARQSTMKSVLGIPGSFTTNCSPVTNRKIKAMLQTTGIGHIRLTGITPALNMLRKALEEVKAKYPFLFSQLSSAGMLCCRAVRGSRSSYSNHSWGTAVDFKVAGVLDPRKDAKAQHALNLMAPIMHKHGFFWGGHYSARYEDAMHWEVANETILKWQREGTV